MVANFYYEEFFKSEQNDIKLLQSCFKFTKYLAITPYRLKKTVSQKFCFVVIALVVISTLVYSMYSELSVIMKLLPDLPDHILLILLYLNNRLFMITAFVGGNLVFDKNWNRLFTLLYQSELTVKKFSLTFSSIKTLRLPFELFTVFGLCLPLHLFQIFTLLKAHEFTATMTNFGWLVVDLYSVAVLFLLMTLNNILSGRYQFLCQCLCEVGERNEDKAGLVDVKLALKMYRVYYYLTNEVTAIFGWHIYFYINRSVIFVITLIKYILLVHMGGTSDRAQFNQRVVYSLSYTVSLTLLIMSFDSVETSGKKVIKTCYLLHESCESPLMKHHLMQLAKLAEKWVPTFSAAGFYIVNQETLSSLFASTLRYMVAIIQLNLALK